MQTARAHERHAVATASSQTRNNQRCKHWHTAVACKNEPGATYTPHGTSKLRTTPPKGKTLESDKGPTHHVLVVVGSKGRERGHLEYPPLLGLLHEERVHEKGDAPAGLGPLDSEREGGGIVVRQAFVHGTRDRKRESDQGGAVRQSAVVSKKKKKKRKTRGGGCPIKRGGLKKTQKVKPGGSCTTKRGCLKKKKNGRPGGGLSDEVRWFPKKKSQTGGGGLSDKSAVASAPAGLRHNGEARKKVGTTARSTCSCRRYRRDYRVSCLLVSRDRTRPSAFRPCASRTRQKHEARMTTTPFFFLANFEHLVGDNTLPLHLPNHGDVKIHKPCSQPHTNAHHPAQRPFPPSHSQSGLRVGR